MKLHRFMYMENLRLHILSSLATLAVPVLMLSALGVSGKGNFGLYFCSSAAKRSTNNQYVCKYIGCINDQSNWSRPFGLVVMMLD